MNYRHIYHAGNICDVAKHAAFTLLIERLRAKDSAFAILDTHAGCGHYDLQDERALKTNEAAEGVHKLWSYSADHDVPNEIRVYLDMLRAVNAGGSALRYYPGSPLIARKLMRPQDRLIACELHEEDYGSLARLFHGDRQAQIHHRDGYASLKAFLPFSEKRGLILIDPPFEVTDEIDRLIAAMRLIQERMPQVMVAVWYPIKERPAIWHFHDALVGAALPKVMASAFIFKNEIRSDRLNGSGLVTINTPWKLDESMTALFAFLRQAMAVDEGEGIVKPLTAL